MRRSASIALFVVGGFCVGMQVMIGFMHVPAGASSGLPPIVSFSAFPIPFLAAATWLSPGRRWRELGMTILIGAAICVGSFAITLGSPVEEGGTGGLGPLNGYVDWTQGWINVAVISVAGLLLIFWDSMASTASAPALPIEKGNSMKGNAPWPVMIVAGLIIVGALATFGALWSGSAEGKAFAQMATSSYESTWLPWAGVLVAIGCGVGMFFGSSNARWLFVFWMAWGVVEGLFWLDQRHFNPIVAGIYLAIGVVLFLPASNAWFSSGKAAAA